MSNELPKAKRILLKTLLQHGASHRAISLAVPCGKATVVRYAKLYNFDVTCGCGQKAGHRGWCHVRLAFSSCRRGFLADMWRKRKCSALTDHVDRAYRAAKRMNHDIGPFIWSEPGTVSLAFATCKICGKQVQLYDDKHVQPFGGRAVDQRCESLEYIAQKRQLRQEKRSWHKGRKILAQLKRELRDQSRWRSAASTPEVTSLS